MKQNVLVPQGPKECLAVHVLLDKMD